MQLDHVLNTFRNLIHAFIELHSGIRMVLRHDRGALGNPGNNDRAIRGNPGNDIQNMIELHSEI